MPVFRFRLEKVLNYRENREKQFRRDLAVAQKNLAGAEAELEVLQTQLVMTRQSAEGMVPDPEQYLILDRYVSNLTRKIREQEQEVTAKRAEVACRVLAVQNTIRERKTLELLKEKKFTGFCRQLELQEQKQNDEYSLFALQRRT